MQGVVQGAVQGAGTVSTAAVEQDSKRATADPRMVAALTALKDSDMTSARPRPRSCSFAIRRFEPLVQALKDPSPDVREEAAHGLSQPATSAPWSR